MDKAIVKIIKDCRAAITDHRARRATMTTDDDIAASVNTMMDVIKKNGFDSLQEYASWDELICWEAYKEFNPISGSCDGCAGLPVQACVQKYGAAVACAAVRPQVASDTIYRVAKMGKANKLTNGKKTTLVCPPGHGFYLSEDDRKEPPFDIDWRVFN